MRATYKCLKCDGTLRMCALYESQGVECWHCDTCDAVVAAEKSGVIPLLGSGIPHLEKALDMLRATQVRHGTMNLDRELETILERLGQARAAIAQALRNMGTPPVQEVKPKEDFFSQLLKQRIQEAHDLSLEGE